MSLVLQVPMDMICPLTCELMINPVTHQRYGYSCEEWAITLWFESGETLCPLTGQPLDRNDFVPNRALQERIMDWRQSIRMNDEERKNTVNNTKAVVEPRKDKPVAALPSSAEQVMTSALVA